MIPARSREPSSESAISNVWEFIVGGTSIVVME